MPTSPTLPAGANNLLKWLPPSDKPQEVIADLLQEEKNGGDVPLHVVQKIDPYALLRSKTETWLNQQIPKQWTLGLFGSRYSLKTSDQKTVEVPRGIYDIKNSIDLGIKNNKSAKEIVAGVKQILESKMNEINDNSFWGYLVWLFSGRSQDTVDRYQELNDTINPKM
jgi:hypothetical protein